MVRQWCERVVERRGPVHVGHRPDPRLAHRRGVDHETESLGERPLVEGRQFHEQVVRVLPVVERLPTEGLAALQQQRVALPADRERLGAHHAVQVQRAAGKLAHRHQHSPIDAPHLVVPSGATLMIELQECVAVHHQHPGAGGEVPGPHGGRVGEPGGARPIRVMGMPKGRCGMPAMGGMPGMLEIRVAWAAIESCCWCSACAGSRLAPAAVPAIARQSVRRQTRTDRCEARRAPAPTTCRVTSSDMALRPGIRAWHDAEAATRSRSASATQRAMRQLRR